MSLVRPSRRSFLIGSGLLGASLVAGLHRRAASRAAGDAQRLIVFYYPDGVPGPSQNGEGSAWHPTGGGASFDLGPVLAPLAAHKDHCAFFRGLSMGGTDAGSHPGGARKLLTGKDGGNGASIDQFLAATVGADRPFRHVLLGAMANQNGASGDKHISYLAPGQTVAPDDDPLHAFRQLFGDAGGGGGAGGGGDPRLASVLDAAEADLTALAGTLGGRERAKLDLHLESLREVERRVTGGGGGGASCEQPLAPVARSAGELYDPARFPSIVRDQIDVLVQAMACDLTRVGVLQCSSHTSELVMSRFEGTEMYDPGFDMRSHQASHYGPSHDPGRREYRDYVAQRRWFAAQFAYLLDRLAELPEGDGTMLDHSLVLFCTEVCDGNTHLHDDMPLVLAGGGGGRVRTGRLYDVGYRRHGDLLAAIAHAMGSPVAGYGDGSGEPLPGLLT